MDFHILRPILGLTAASAVAVGIAWFWWPPATPPSTTAIPATSEPSSEPVASGESVPEIQPPDAKPPAQEEPGTAGAVYKINDVVELRRLNGITDTGILMILWRRNQPRRHPRRPHWRNWSAAGRARSRLPPLPRPQIPRSLHPTSDEHPRPPGPWRKTVRIISVHRWGGLTQPAAPSEPECLPCSFLFSQRRDGSLANLENAVSGRSRRVCARACRNAIAYI